MAESADVGTPEKRSLIEGNKWRCPGCAQSGTPFLDFKALELKEEHRHELFQVYCHVKHRGGCGHVFAPGEPWIIQAYLSGDLLPADLLKAEKRRVAELEAELEKNQNTTHDERGIAA